MTSMETTLQKFSNRNQKVKRNSNNKVLPINTYGANGKK